MRVTARYLADGEPARTTLYPSSVEDGYAAIATRPIRHADSVEASVEDPRAPVPDEDAPRLKEMGITGIYGPGASTEDIIREVREAVKG